MTKVFISSVDRPLRHERDGLAALLPVVPSTPRFEPIRFEDFTAQNRSSREACLAGVTASDVVVLLLGSTYGTPRPDSTISPTQEEFEQAIRLGKPVLAFVQETDTPDEPRQAEFKKRVQDYANGYFRDAFTNAESLNLAVLAALGNLGEDQTELTWSDLSAPLPISWLQKSDDQARLDGPGISLHLLPVGLSRLRARQLEQMPDHLTRLARERGFFSHTDSVTATSSASTAQTWRSPQARRSVFGGRTDTGVRGIVVHQTGQITVYDTLPSDFLGSLVNPRGLQEQLATLLAIAIALLPDPTLDVAPAASLGPADRVMEGDPTTVGNRSSGHLPTGRREKDVVAEPSSTVTSAALRQHPGDVSAELAATLLANLRAMGR